ncbi:hypothetical protein BRC68_11550 [Halobacteriales archaeon QH_6_64_20]|nr:MAG: hypothetical protein BRC68_11550 [Halobacteriales archaeon QH_6_64_20]
MDRLKHGPLRFARVRRHANCNHIRLRRLDDVPRSAFVAGETSSTATVPVATSNRGAIRPVPGSRDRTTGAR